MNVIERLMERVDTDPAVIGSLSCGEVIAVAFIWNRLDLLPDAYSHPLDALDRLGESWREMVIEYRREHR